MLIAGNLPVIETSVRPHSVIGERNENDPTQTIVNN